MVLDPVIKLAVQAAIALLFATAAWHKLRDWPRIGGVVAGYRIIPQGLSQPAAALLIALELAIVAGLLIAPNTLFGAAVLLLAYAWAISLNIVRGNDRIDCGCSAYSVDAPRLKWTMVARNTVVALIAIVAAVQPASPRPLIWMDALTFAFALAGCCILYITLESTIALPSRGANA